MIEREYFEILQQAVLAAVSECDQPNLPIAFIDVPFIVPDDQKYLEVVIIPNESIETWGEEKICQGLFRLILHWPKNGSGAYPPLDVLGSITRFFTKDRPLQNVRIYETATFAGVLDGGADALYPANMRYRSIRT
jgi:hypothetical protein